MSLLSDNMYIHLAPHDDRCFPACSLNLSFPPFFFFFVLNKCFSVPKASSHDHRSLAGSPTKSPSSGLHKPTWKPSSKPAEHRRLKEVAATKTAPQVAAKALKAEIVDEKKTLTSLDKTEKAQVKVDINQNQKIVKDVKILGMRTDVTNTASQELLPPKALKKVNQTMHHLFK